MIGQFIGKAIEARMVGMFVNVYVLNGRTTASGRLADSREYSRHLVDERDDRKLNSRVRIKAVK